MMHDPKRISPSPARRVSYASEECPTLSPTQASQCPSPTLVQARWSEESVAKDTGVGLPQPERKKSIGEVLVSHGHGRVRTISGF